MMSSSFNLGLYPYLHMSMKIGLGIPFIEDLHKASLFSLATILSVGVFLSQSPTIWCDKVSSLAIASNPVFHARTKHIEV